MQLWCSFLFFGVRLCLSSIIISLYDETAKTTPRFYHRQKPLISCRRNIHSPLFTQNADVISRTSSHLSNGSSLPKRYASSTPSVPVSASLLKLSISPRGCKPHLLQVLHSLNQNKKTLKFSLLSSFNLKQNSQFLLFLLSFSEMELRLFKLQLIYHNYSSKVLLIKIFLLATAMAAIPCLNLVYNVDRYSSDHHSWTINPSKHRMNVSELHAAFEQLIAGDWLRHGHKALALGRDSMRAVMVMRKLGFPDAIGVDRKPCSSLVKRGDIYGLPFKRTSLDFVFSTAVIDGVSVPAKMVLEMERVLRPGRVGVVLRRVYGRFPTTTAVMKAAAPVASYLKVSEIVGVRSVNCTVMVIFRKRVGPKAQRITTPLPLAS